jgi:hypothetical protein
MSLCFTGFFKTITTLQKTLAIVTVSIYIYWYVVYHETYGSMQSQLYR